MATNGVLVVLFLLFLALRLTSTPIAIKLHIGGLYIGDNIVYNCTVTDI